MKLLRSILTKALRPRSVNPATDASVLPANIPIAVRPITGLQLASVRLVKRPTILAIFGARNAVRTNTPGVAYLRTQRAIYCGSVPRDLTAPLPDTDIDEATADLLVRWPSDTRHPSETIFDAAIDSAPMQGPVAAEAAFQRNASLAAGEAISRRLEENEADRRIVERQLRDIDEQLERIESDRNASTAARTTAVEEGTATIAAPVAVPSLAGVLFWRFVEVATIIGESINCATALLNANGADPSNLAVEWEHGAAGMIAGCVVSALVISTLLFVISEWAFARIASALDEQQDPARGFRMLTATAALVFVTTGVAGLAFLRAQLGGPEHLSWGAVCVYFIVGAAPLVGGTLVHLRTNARCAARQAALQLVATPKAADVAQRLRSEHEEQLIAQRDRLHRRRDALTATNQRLNAQMHGAEQAIRDIARHEQTVVLQWLDSLRAALAKDRKYFEQYARAWGRTHLLPPTPTQPAGILVPIRKRRTP